MGAELNRLISMGGTQNKSPYQRYLMGKEQAVQDNTNALTMESKGLDIKTKRQDMAVIEEERKLKRVDNFYSSIAPMYKEVLSSDNPELAYKSYAPKMQAAADAAGVPLKDVNVYEPELAKSIVKKYDPFTKPDIYKTPVQDEKGRYFEQSQAISPSTGEVKDYGKKPLWQQTEALSKNYGKGKADKTSIRKSEQKIKDYTNAMDSLRAMRDYAESADSSTQTWGAAGLDSFLTGITKLTGVEMTGDLEKFQNDLTYRNTVIKTARAAYRKAVTGLQSSRQEMKDIEATYPAEGDTVKKMSSKAKTLLQIMEAGRLRESLALKNGLEFVFRGKDGQLVYRDKKNGNRLTLDDLPSMGNIQPFDQMRNTLYKQIVKADPSTEGSSAMQMSLRKMGEMGYDMSGVRGGF